jgi:hypothetical protein
MAGYQIKLRYKIYVVRRPAELRAINPYSPISVIQVLQHLKCKYGDMRYLGLLLVMM